MEKETRKVISDLRQWLFKVPGELSETYGEKWSGNMEEIGEKMGNNEKRKSRSWEVLWDTDKGKRNKHEHSHPKVEFVSNKLY